MINNRKHKASNEDIIEFIEMYLGDGTKLTRVDLLDKLCKDFKASQRTIESRIAEIINTDVEIFNNNGNPCRLTKEIEGKVIYYSLKHNGSQ